MKKAFYAAILLSISLIGCSNPNNVGTYSSQYQTALDIDNDFKNCIAKQVRAETGRSIIVVRCPNSTTSTTYISDKVQKTNIVIDGVKYVPEK